MITIIGPKNAGIAYYGRYDDQSKTLFVDDHNSAGFGFVCSRTLHSLMEIHKNITNEPVTVFWQSTIWNKPGESSSNAFDLYFNQCKTTESISINKDYEDQPATNIGLKQSDINVLSTITDKYFTLSNEVKETESKIIKKYDIKFDETIVFYYRGTDKYMECARIPPSYYLKILKKHLI